MIADGLSRVKLLPSGWMLDMDSFPWIFNQGLSSKVDLFATRELLVYASPVNGKTFSFSWDLWSDSLLSSTNLDFEVLTFLELFQGMTF